MARIKTLEPNVILGGKPRPKGYTTDMPENAATALALSGRVRILSEGAREDGLNELQRASLPENESGPGDADSEQSEQEQSGLSESDRERVQEALEQDDWTKIQDCVSDYTDESPIGLEKETAKSLLEGLLNDG